MFKLIKTTSVSASFEIQNDLCFYTKEAYDVLIDSKLLLSSHSTNVFSIFNLEPDTTYTVTVIKDNEESSLSFKTKKESTSVNVKRFGAKGNGIHNDTSAIQAAIASIPKDGRIIFPKGNYRTTPIFLKDDITLEFKKGATLLGETDRNKYPIIPGYLFSTDESKEYHLNSWEGNPVTTFASLITAQNVKNISIIGEGSINGNAHNSDWWIAPKKKNISWRPRLLFLNNCENITLHGMTFENSPSWTINPFRCNQIDAIDINIKSPADSPNTDAFNPESCSNISIIGAKFSVGDDCITLKSGKLFQGMLFPRPTENVIVRNCHMNHGHGAVVLGSEISGGVRNIDISQCLFENTDRGLRIKTRRGRGKNSVVDGITFRNIEMNHVKTPIAINMFYRCDPDGDSDYVQTEALQPKDEWTPFLGDFTFQDMKCNNVHYAAVYAQGLPEEKIKSITLKNIQFSYSSSPTSGKPIMKTIIDNTSLLGAYFYNVESVSLQNVSFTGQQGDELILKEVDRYERT